MLLHLPSRLFSEVDRGGSPPRTGSGGNKEHGHRVGEAGPQLTSVHKHIEELRTFSRAMLQAFSKQYCLVVEKINKQTNK